HLYVNNDHIADSPFLVNVTEGTTNSTFSYAVGEGLSRGAAGRPSAFTVVSFDSFQNQIKSRDTDSNTDTSGRSVFVYHTSGSEMLNGTLLPCRTLTRIHPLAIAVCATSARQRQRRT